EARKQLALAGAPLGRPTHHAVELVGEPAAEHVGPVHQRLDHAERLGRRMIPVQDLQPHLMTPSAAASRRRPSSTATAPVRSKVSSSLPPASFPAWPSASVIVYAAVRTFSRYDSSAPTPGSLTAHARRPRPASPTIRPACAN